MRSFKLWKAQMMYYLLKLEHDDEGFKEMKKEFINRLKRLRRDWISNFLLDLYCFLDLYNISIPKEIYPTQEEIREWIK